MILDVTKLFDQTKFDTLLVKLCEEVGRADIAERVKCPSCEIALSDAVLYFDTLLDVCESCADNFNSMQDACVRIRERASKLLDELCHESKEDVIIVLDEYYKLIDETDAKFKQAHDKALKRFVQAVDDDRNEQY